MDPGRCPASPRLAPSGSRISCPAHGVYCGQALCPEKVPAMTDAPADTRPRIAITMGDGAGVGPEVIVKSLAHRDLYERCQPLVVGDLSRLKAAEAVVRSGLRFTAIKADQVDAAA